MQRIVYAHIDGNKIKFSFRPDAKASVAGQFEQSEYDEQVTWHWHPVPGSGRQPSQEWLYRNFPLDT